MLRQLSATSASPRMRGMQEEGSRRATGTHVLLDNGEYFPVLKSGNTLYSNSLESIENATVARTLNYDTRRLIQAGQPLRGLPINKQHYPGTNRLLLNQNQRRAHALLARSGAANQEYDLGMTMGRTRNELQLKQRLGRSPEQVNPTNYPILERLQGCSPANVGTPVSQLLLQVEEENHGRGKSLM